jgi:hypothetical protein
MRTLMLALLLTGCGSSHGSGTANTAADTGLSLAGTTWRTPCAKDGSMWSQWTLVFQDSSTKTMTVQRFSSEGCGNLVVTHKSTATYVIGAAAPNLTNTYAMDIKETAITVAFSGASTIKGANTDKDYGLSNWADGVAQDVAGKKQSETATPEAAVGLAQYDLLKVDGPTLMLGDFELEDGTSPEKRPTALDTTLVFTKQ